MTTATPQVIRKPTTAILRMETTSQTLAITFTPTMFTTPRTTDRRVFNVVKEKIHELLARNLKVFDQLLVMIAESPTLCHLLTKIDF